MVQKALSVVIPTWNEEKNVQLLVERLDKALSKAEIVYELIFVDDHSTDRTQEIIRQLSIEYPILLHIKRGKRGKATSLLEGFAYVQYDVICMVDADLQYPPEAIPQMFEMIDENADIVVANRREQRVPFYRKIVSWTYLFFFGKVLHGFDCDIQSGLKLFKKEIVERLTLSPSPWTFDLEFLIKARDAGYQITSFNIVFSKRYSGSQKISLINATFEIGFSALRLKFKKPEIIPFHAKAEQVKGKGFHYKGVEFIHHTDLNHEESAFFRLHGYQKTVLLFIVSIILLGLITHFHTTLTIIIGALISLFFADLLFNIFLILRSFSNPSEIHIESEELDALSDKNWPTYTVLCPLYREWHVLPQFITAMSSLDYPKEKLQVMLLLEEDDSETLKRIGEISLPSYFQVVVVPNSLPKTKPKAMNYGLKFAKGEYIVVYDAEDIPDSQQLKKAVLAFGKADKRTICVQAKLNFYNPQQNILTRVFSAEYSLWFDLVLTGLQSIHAPIPLGGTSNHFRREDVLNLKAWDAFNVTEDCDLGMRLVKKGYRTAMIDSLTLEEANSDFKNWFAQRTRWIKGYIQTYLVHTRNPKAFLKDAKEPHFLGFQFIVGGRIFSMLINPIMWITTIVYFAFRTQTAPFIEPFFPPLVLYMGVFSMIFGNFLYMYYYMIGCVKREHYDLVKYVFLVPLYWLAMSVAAYVSVYKFIKQPHYWSKTTHGLHLQNKNAVIQATHVIGRDLINGDLAGITSEPLPVFIHQAHTRDMVNGSNGKPKARLRLKSKEDFGEIPIATEVRVLSEEIN